MSSLFRVLVWGVGAAVIVFVLSILLTDESAPDQGSILQRIRASGA